VLVPTACLETTVREENPAQRVVSRAWYHGFFPAAYMPGLHIPSDRNRSLNCCVWHPSWAGHEPRGTTSPK
jgi:hypothetical protein